MEFKARTYFDRLNILITRPFNYTGLGQEPHFLIPKIVKHFKERKEEIELGNIDVVRDFSDVRFVAAVYKKLMECNTSSEIVNICSCRGVTLKDILQKMSSIARHELRTKINPAFVRKNEVKTLIGSNKKLVSLIGESEPYPIEETLKWMFDAT
jgi:nucleoside-diphosphate-sugar epimerase